MTVTSSDIARRIITTDSALSLLIDQWQESPRMQELQRGKFGLIRELLIEPLERIERYINIDHAVGRFLDDIGERLGLQRPSIPGSLVGYPAFGFRDSDGVTFSQGRFQSANPLIGPRVPLGDGDYRKLLLVRAGAITSPTTIPRMNETVRRGFPAAYYTDGDGIITLTVGESSTLVSMVTDLEIWPRPVGVELMVA